MTTGLTHDLVETVVVVVANKWEQHEKKLDFYLIQVQFTPYRRRDLRGSS